jgi:hypothetical protein
VRATSARRRSCRSISSCHLSAAQRRR